MGSYYNLPKAIFYLLKGGYIWEEERVSVVEALASPKEGSFPEEASFPEDGGSGARVIGCRFLDLGLGFRV